MMELLRRLLVLLELTHSETIVSVRKQGIEATSRVHKWTQKRGSGLVALMFAGACGGSHLSHHHLTVYGLGLPIKVTNYKP